MVASGRCEGQPPPKVLGGDPKKKKGKPEKGSGENNLSFWTMGIRSDTCKQEIISINKIHAANPEERRQWETACKGYRTRINSKQPL